MGRLKRFMEDQEEAKYNEDPDYYFPICGACGKYVFTYTNIFPGLEDRRCKKNGKCKSIQELIDKCLK